MDWVGGLSIGFKFDDNDGDGCYSPDGDVDDKCGACGCASALVVEIENPDQDPRAEPQVELSDWPGQDRFGGEVRIIKTTDSICFRAPLLSFYDGLRRKSGEGKRTMSYKSKVFNVKESLIIYAEEALREIRKHLGNQREVS